MITAVVYWLSGGVYFLIGAAFLRLEDVAALSALQNLFAPVGQFIVAMSRLMLPLVSARFTEGDLVFRRSITRITTVFSVAALSFDHRWRSGGGCAALLPSDN